jgi:adenine-specific DNA-methyltransferase
MDLKIFSQLDFLPALKALFRKLEVPINYVADEPTTAKEILKDTYKDNDTFQGMDDVFFVGMVDDAAFEGNASLAVDKIKSDYDGILVFGVTLKDRPNGLLPTRSQLAEISRAFNREFYYTPVVVVFKYGNHIAFANTERLKFKQESREGEKAGKVTLLRDIHIEKPHSGHERILAELKIPSSGKNQVDSFAKLYSYWQEVFSVSVLNKKFYQELSNWYFWATKHVTFPGEPTLADAHMKNAPLEDLLQEHKATNVIRMLTRLLFVWFIKEKKLIPEELFELESLQKDILNEISPYHETGMFKERNKESVYYKAILQNLFFATLNCPIEGDSLDKRKRGFRGDESKGKHFAIDWMMRYKKYFKNPDAFIKLVNDTTPFLNGGLFECLDDKTNKKIVDCFSDNENNQRQLIVPDYLFFGLEEDVDISDVVGIDDKKYKNAAVKGLINILKSYKFTITENTPIEEDVALDPELLGKVFENLLASYNPETKSTARKQTGSFYTPREIVNYMVDESLIAYLKNAISDWGGLDDETLDKELHVLTSFDSKVPFNDKPALQKDIIAALSTCTILDPACGSGAFPMGILQKMVHILQKLDPDNKQWKELQLQKAEQDSKAAFEIEDKQAREERLLEINEAFDQNINDPDYARKLFLIENCIYGVDIQPIATQISKLRFFISLVVDQKANDKPENNFGIRPLPNLETKFVAANTLIGIEKDGGLFETDRVKKLESDLKLVRHKIFGLKSKERKIIWREKDKKFREELSDVLKNQGLPLDAAENLAKWDPYSQNDSSPFFDSEWMFGIKDGFDVVIGNPPYVRPRNEDLAVIKYYRKSYEVAQNQIDLFHLFIEKAIKQLKNGGINSFIISDAFLGNEQTTLLRNFILKNTYINIIVDINKNVFEGASVDTVVYIFEKKKTKDVMSKCIHIHNNEFMISHLFNSDYFIHNPRKNFTISLNYRQQEVFDEIRKIKTTVDQFYNITTGIKEYQQGKGKPPQTLKVVEQKSFNSNTQIDATYLPEIRGKNLQPFSITWNGEYIRYGPWLAEPRTIGVFENGNIVVRQIPSKSRQVLSVISEHSPETYIVDQTIYIGTNINRKEIDDFYAVGVLSSRLIHWYFKVSNNENDTLFPKIKISQINELPIKVKSEFSLISLLSKFLHRKFDNTVLNVLDALVFNLYFPDHMKERSIDILEYVQQDIAKVMQGREFENLTDPEKENVIEQLHTIWSHPDNEVRNRIKLFSVRSPEILKPILES